MANIAELNSVCLLSSVFY